METIYLIGAEDVRSAGSSIRQSANEMQRAAASMEESFRIQRLFLDDWILRFEQALNKKE